MNPIAFMTLTQKLKLLFIRKKFSVLARLSKSLAAKKAFDLFVTPQTRLLKPLPKAFEGADRLTFSFEGNAIVGYRLNPSPKKVLILHGFESSVLNFDKYLTPLVEKGYEVLAFDAPAHGQSSGRRINAIDYKNFILHLIKTYGPINSFITHSFGGLAISLALEELPHDESWKLVLMAPATESTTAIDNFFNLLQLNKEVRKRFDLFITKANNKPPSWYSVSRASKNIKAQVLFLQDKNDILTPLSDVEPIMAKHYPNFQFHISEGLGHSRIYHDAGSIKQIMRFL